MMLRGQQSKSRSLTSTLLLVCYLLLFMGMPAAAAAETASIAVLYPEIREPYRSVFSRITDGIRKQSRIRVETYALRDELDVSNLQAWLQSERSKVIIALGHRGLKAAQRLENSPPVVVGAVLLPPGASKNGISGVSLTPDPGMLFARLKSMQPQVKRVTVVYDPQRNEGLIRLAKTAAKAQGLELVALKAANLSEAAPIYREILRNRKSGSDAIWLPQDPNTVDDRIILPLILKEAWNSKLVVFSSNPAHIKRGVLFALYPDNFALGRSLARLALAQLNNNAHPGPGIATLKDLLIAVNLRTADHLELKITSQQRREFDLTFPAP